MKSGFALTLAKLEKRVFYGFTKRARHPHFQAKNVDFMYNGFNGQFNSIPYNNHKLVSSS
jgi:hypothetical protein